MFLMQRLGSDMTEEYVQGYLDQIASHPGSCDNVWLATKYGFPPLDVHRAWAAELAEYAKRFRGRGVRVSLQLSNSIGHGQYMAARDCSGLVYDGSPAEKLVGPDGTVADYCFCWRGKHVREYLLEELKAYAQVQPDCLWVDDDFRAANHSPVAFGCFCDGCVAAFGERYGRVFTRKELVEEVLHGDPVWRRRFAQFTRKGMYDLLFAMCRTFHDLSPRTVPGLQHASHGPYIGNCLDFLFDAMKDATGKIPYSRPGGGAYNDHDPNVFLDKALDIAYQNSLLPEYVTGVCPEIENLPFVAYGKTPAGTALETSIDFAAGATDMSYSMLMSTADPMAAHETEFALLASQRPYWRSLAAVNGASRPDGMRMFLPAHAGERKLLPSEGFDELSRLHTKAFGLWLRDAFPLTFDKRASSVTLLHGDVAAGMSDGEIEELLYKPVITDGETVALLAKRGYLLPVTAKSIAQDDVRRLREVMTDDRVVPPEMPRWSSSHFTPGKKDCCYLETVPGQEKNVRALGFYENTAPLPPFTADREHPYGMAEAIVTTARGAKWAVLAYMPWKGIISRSKREQIFNIADELSGNGLCARLQSGVQAAVFARVGADGRTLCVSVVNCTVGESKDVRLLVRRPAGERFVFRSQYGGEIAPLPAERQEDGTVVTLPPLAPWSVGTVFCEA